MICKLPLQHSGLWSALEPCSMVVRKKSGDWSKGKKLIKLPWWCLLVSCLLCFLCSLFFKGFYWEATGWAGTWTTQKGADPWVSPKISSCSSKISRISSFWQQVRGNYLLCSLFVTEKGWGVRRGGDDGWGEGCTRRGESEVRGEEGWGWGVHEEGWG